MDSCGKLLLSQTKLPSGAHIIDDLWIHHDLWVIMIMMGNAKSNKHKPDSWLTFLSLLFPPGLLDFWVFWDLRIFLLLLDIVQKAEDVFPGFPDFVFEHVAMLRSGDTPPGTELGTRRHGRGAAHDGAWSSAACLARAPHHGPLQSLTSHWAYLPLAGRYLNVDTQWALVTYLHNTIA